MRFRRLHIPAYGKFTDFSISFPKGESDFQLIYGPNEAGKSTLLQAIHDFLFGIHSRSTANFLHDYNELRIEAELEDAKGRSHTFRRRKGNKDTLLDASESPVPELLLSEILGVVSESYFTSMFGMGSEELRAGANELLSGKGDLGGALFSARLGGTPVDRVIETLKNEADVLFSGRSRGRIREAIKRYKDHQKAKKEALIDPEKWGEVVQALAEETRQLDLLKTEIRTKQRRRNWLELCRSARSLVSEWKDSTSQLTGLAHLPELASGFTAETREAQKNLIATERELQQIESHLSRLQEESSTLVLRPEILEAQARISDLHARLGGYQKDLQESQKLATQTELQRKEIQSRCGELDLHVPLEELESAKLSHAQFLETTRLAGDFEAAQKAVGDLEAKIEKAQGDLKRLAESSPESDPARLERLKWLLDLATEKKGIATNLPKLESELKSLERKVRSGQARLSGAPESPEATSLLPVPEKARIQEFQKQFEDLNHQKTGIELANTELRKEIRAVEVALETIDRQGEIPTLEDLEVSRQRRNALWYRILDAWKQREENIATEEGIPLDTAYSASVDAADEIADRLRSHANLVAQKEESLSKRSFLQQKLEDENQRLAQVTVQIQTLEKAWHEAWQTCHLTPSSPAAMIEWRENWEEFCRDWEARQNQRDRLDNQRAEVRGISKDLAEALGSQSEDFSQLLSEAQHLRKQLDDARTRENTRLDRLKEKEFELEESLKHLPEKKAAFETAKAEWQSQARRCSLPPEIAPSSSIEILQARKELFIAHKTWRENLSKLEELRKNIASYQQEGIHLAHSLLGMDETEILLCENALSTALNAAKQSETDRQNYERQIRDCRFQLEEINRRREHIKTDLDRQYAAAGLSADEALDSALVEQRLIDLNRRETLTEQERNLRSHLSAMTDGVPFAEFIERFQAEALIDLDEELEKLDEELDELDARRNEVQGRIIVLDSDKKAFENAQDNAAREEQNADFALSSVRNDAERYIRLQVAITMLHNQIDTFREQNQGPFMEKASFWFSEITGGAFAGIKPSYKDGDDPVIVGIRAGQVKGKGVDIPAMSEGTRDQLYLALRFAGLEMHLERHAPVPMILDDLLVHFDDQRSIHVLQALSRLARKSQILLFTHHRHIVDLARDQLDADDFHLTEI